MVTIYNCLQQRLLINLAAGKNLDIYAGGIAVLIETDMDSPHLKGLIARGDIMICSEVGSGQNHPVAKNEPKITPAVTSDAMVQSDPVKGTKVQPKVGTEAKTLPSQTGKGESTTTSHKRVSNPKPSSGSSAGKK